MEAVLHTILMKDRESGVEVTYKSVVDYEVILGGCRLVLHMLDGSTASFEKDDWKLYDLTPQPGWNSRAVNVF